jgi:hypothetical protein
MKDQTEFHVTVLVQVSIFADDEDHAAEIVMDSLDGLTVVNLELIETEEVGE